MYNIFHKLKVMKKSKIFIVFVLFMTNTFAEQSECKIEISKDNISMHNEKCGIFWEINENHWQAVFKIKNRDNWIVIA